MRTAWMLCILCAGLALSTADAAPARSGAPPARLVAACEVAPPAYVAWGDKMLAADKGLGFWADGERCDSLDDVVGAYLALRLAKVRELAKPGVRLVLVRAGAPGGPAEDLPLALPEAGSDAEKAQAPAGILGLALDLDPRALPVGEACRVVAILRDGEKEIERVEWPLRKLSQAPPTRERVQVPLKVLHPNPAADVSEPVALGVPLPKGALHDAAQARVLDAAGAEVPAQVEVSGRWNRRGSVRWLGVRFVAAHRKGRPESRYVLEYGSAVRRAAVPAPVQVAQSDDALAITTGPMRVLVPRKNGRVIEKVFLDLNGNGIFEGDEVAAEAGPAGGPHQVDDAGRRYTAALDTEPEVVVEERGPVRAVVRIESWYEAEDGRRLCKQITRLHAYRGLARLDLSHGWLMTVRSEDARFADIGFSLAVPGARRLALAGESDQMLFTDTASPSISRYLLQDGWGHFGIHMNFRETPFADPRQRSYLRTRMAAEGARSEGWGALAGPRAGVAVGCEDFWQNYPKEVSVAGDRLTFHSWPAHAEEKRRPLKPDELNNLYWLHEAKVLNFKVPPEVTNFPEKNWHTSKYFMNLAKLPDAMGTMKTHEVRWLFFPSRTRNDSLRGQMRAALQPSVAVVDPRAMVASGVFGPLSLKDAARNPDEERALDASVGSEAPREEMNRAYGKFVFGDGFSNYDFSEHRFSVYRNWRNTHHGCNRTPWLLFFRSGDPFFYLRGLRNARKVLDGGICHYIPPERVPAAADMDGWKVKVVGGLHDYKAYVPWGAGGRVGDYNSTTDFMLYLTHFTGNPRGREVALEWWKGVTDWVSPGGSARSQAGTLSAAIDLYQDTWDRRMLPFIHSEFAGMCTGWDAKHNRFNEWQNYAPWLERYWYLTGSPAAREVLVRWADAFVEGYGDLSSEWGPNGLNILAAATLATGDEKYLRRGNWLAYHQSLSMGNDPNSMYDGYAFLFGEGISLNNYFQQELPYLLEARNRFRRDVGTGDNSSFDVHPLREEPALGHVTEWWFLDEKDAPVSMLFRLRGNSPTVRLAVFGPDGRPVLERDVALDMTHPHGYEGTYAHLRLELPPDGKRGVYRGMLSNKGNRFAVRAPITAGLREVYAAKEGAIGIRCGRAAFTVPANSGTYTIGAESKSMPGPLYVQDEAGKTLSTGWCGLTPDGKVQVGFPYTFDSVARQRLCVMANYGDAATFTIRGKSPPKYYAVSAARLFDPEGKR